LPSNPSTGYRWRVENSASSVLHILSPEVYSAPEEEEVVGSAGVSTWRFLANSTGDAQLVLVYQQPWAADVAPVQTFDCKVIVR
jgi:inhibitor of cysteine peptidase